MAHHPPSPLVPLPSTHSRLNSCSKRPSSSLRDYHTYGGDAVDDYNDGDDPGASLSNNSFLTKDHRITPRTQDARPHVYRRNSDVSSSTPRPVVHSRHSDTRRRHVVGKQQSLSSLSSHYNTRLSLDAHQPHSRRHQQQVVSMDVEQPALYLGDTVQVPGGMSGTVKFIGNVNGKNGTFAGVELDDEFASRGKNDGDVDGIRYFTTSVPGAGIFLPTHRAVKLASPTLTPEFPPTPTTPGFQQSFDINSRLSAAASSTRTPPTPALPKFSQSVGPGSRPSMGQSTNARASSPQLKAPGKRPSLPRPESPQRRQAPTSAPTPQPARTSTSGITAATRRLPLSPAPKKNAPAKPSTPAPARSTSRSQSRQTDRSPEQHQQTSPQSVPNGRRESLTSTRPGTGSGASDEAGSLRRTLEERDRQLKEQASSLADMESSLAELQSMMTETVVNQRGSTTGAPEPGTEDADTTQLRSLLREKNEKIAMLTAEFDGHRADFRSTIDALEMASTETERVYEKRIQELLEEVKQMQEAQDDVASITQQLKALEELVAELEEGLEDSRRGESEARSEVEFLRGEVERSRSELRRERDKAARALKGAGAAVGEATSAGGATSPSKEVEARDDEIRGLKAIIHSLSSGSEMGTPRGENRSSLQADSGLGAASGAASGPSADEFAEMKKSIEALQREKGELQGLIERKNYHEEELERELNDLRKSSNSSGLALQDPDMSANSHNKSPSDSSTGTARTAQENHNPHNSITSVRTAIGPVSPDLSTSNERPASDSKPKSSRPSNGSNDSNESSLWCDICEAAGHDVLTCVNIGTHDASSARKSIDSLRKIKAQTTPAPSHPVPSPQSTSQRNSANSLKPKEAPKEAPQDTAKPLPAPPVRQERDLEKERAEDKSALAGDGPAPGKSSKTIDMTLWCAMCERDGHSSVDCPFDDF